jgi:polygalacturonase
MTDLNRRHIVDAAFAAAALCILNAPGERARANSEAVSVLDFRSPRDADDSAAFQKAIATRRPVHVPASAGLGPNGVYLVDDVTLIAGAQLFGDGIGRTILRPGGNQAVFHCDSGSDVARIVGIHISNLTLEGWVVKRRFAEHRHLLHLNGVQEVLIENTEIKGFQGDGICLGSSRQAGITRHNRGIIIRNCVFDGVNNDNRNGISVIDGEQILIEEHAWCD